MAASSQAAPTQDIGTLKMDCVFQTRSQVHQIVTVDFDRRTINGQAAMIGPDAMHWKEGDHGYRLDRVTGILTLLVASKNVVFKLQCNTVNEP